MIKAAIFYHSTKSGGDRRKQRVETPDGAHQAFIRMEVVEAESLSDALDMAKPERGEDVMNTHEVA